MEPNVIGWMPAAAVYFRDPDGHMLEYLTMLDDKDRRPDLIVSWSVDYQTTDNRVAQVRYEKFGFIESYFVFQRLHCNTIDQ